MAPDALVGGLKGQQEGGHANEQAAHQADLGRAEGIEQRENQQDGRGQEGEDVLDQKEGGRAGDVVDDPAALPHHLGQSGEVGVQQHQMGDLLGRIAARCHGDAAIGVLEGQHIVDPVPQHGHRVAPPLEGMEELLLLLGGDPAEDGVLLRQEFQIGVGGQGGEVQPALGAAYSGPLGDVGHRGGVVPRDDLDGHPLFPEIGQGLGGVRAELVGEEEEGQRLRPGSELVPRQNLTAPGQQEHTLPGGGRLLQTGGVPGPVGP